MSDPELSVCLRFRTESKTYPTSDYVIVDDGFEENLKIAYAMAIESAKQKQDEIKYVLGVIADNGKMQTPAEADAILKLLKNHDISAEFMQADGVRIADKKLIEDFEGGRLK